MESNAEKDCAQVAVGRRLEQLAALKRLTRGIVNGLPAAAAELPDLPRDRLERWGLAAWGCLSSVSVYRGPSGYMVGGLRCRRHKACAACAALRANIQAGEWVQWCTAQGWGSRGDVEQVMMTLAPPHDESGRAGPSCEKVGRVMAALGKQLRYARSDGPDALRPVAVKLASFARALVGGVGSLEIIRGEDGLLHPHWHCLLLTRGWFDWGATREALELIAAGVYGRQACMVNFKGIGGDWGEVREGLKYPFKMTDRPSVVWDLVAASYHRRWVRRFGEYLGHKAEYVGAVTDYVESWVWDGDAFTQSAAWSPAPLWLGGKYRGEAVPF